MREGCSGLGSFACTWSPGNPGSGRKQIKQGNLFLSGVPGAVCARMFWCALYLVVYSVWTARSTLFHSVTCEVICG